MSLSIHPAASPSGGDEPGFGTFRDPRTYVRVFVGAFLRDVHSFYPGCRIEPAPTIMHGKTSDIAHDGSGVFAGLPSPFTGARYHSLALAPDSVPDALAVTARAEDGTVQGLRHRTLPIHGVQFHPESIVSAHGHKLLGNFLALAARVGPLP